jgi:hypothetical protein
MGRPNGDYDPASSLRAWAAEAEAAAGIAKALAGTAFVPDQLRRYLNPQAKPEQRQLDYDGTVATVTAVLLAGQELGFGPMASLRSITIIKNTVALYAIAARALLQQRGHEIIVKESTSERAVVVARRQGGEWQTATWDITRARTAKLFPGAEYSNWRTQTKAMLVARATAEACRWIASDALLGLPAMAEELEENSDGQVPPAEIGSVATSHPALEAPKTTKRRTAPARVALPAATMPPAADPAPPAPTAPTAPVPEEPTVRPQLTPKQRNRIHASLRDLEVHTREQGLDLLSVWTGRTVKSTNDLTPEEAMTVIDRLDQLLSITKQDEAEHPATGKHHGGNGDDHDEPPGEPPDAEPD